MARIKGKDLYLKDDDQIYFGNNYEAALWYYAGELRLNHTISGTYATQPYHLIRYDQVEQIVTATISGITISGISNHNNLYGLQGTGPDYYHLSSDQYIGLTASGVTDLHTHDFKDLMFFTDGSAVIDSANGNIVRAGGY